MNTIDFAINMELEGQKYYLDQAELNRDNELHAIFLMLADSEEGHANLLRRYKSKEALTLQADFVRPGLKSVFDGLGNFSKEDNTRQLDVYRIACQQEEKSIQLYREMEEQAEESEKELFCYLVRQEEEHLLLFEELVKLLTRPEEWVESAEFGIREEY